MLWMFILLGMLIATIGFLIYLVSRFGKFYLIRKYAGEKKWLRIFVSFGCMCLIGTLCGYFFEFINAAIIMIHLGVFWMIWDAVFLFWEKRHKYTGQCYRAGIFALVFTTVYLSCAWYLANHVWEKDYVIDTEKPVGSLRIVQFADSHIGTTFHGEGFEHWMQKIQKVEPDIVVITGDYVDDDTSLEDMRACCESLGKLKTSYGVFYSFGNHDKGYFGEEYRGYNGADLIAELEKNGVTVLQDEVIPIDDRFYIIGRQDRSEEQRGTNRATMKELTEALDPSMFSIVLDHQPHDYAAQQEAGIDLVLSGHTHAGQLFPFNRMGQWLGIDDKSYGYEKRGESNFIVTSGISDWAIKFRTGCKAEFVVVDIKET